MIRTDGAPTIAHPPRRPAPGWLPASLARVRADMARFDLRAGPPAARAPLAPVSPARTAGADALARDLERAHTRQRRMIRTEGAPWTR